MPANDFLRVETDATSLANALTSGAAAQFAAKLPAEAGTRCCAIGRGRHASRVVVGAEHRRRRGHPGRRPCCRGSPRRTRTAVAKQNEQALSDTVADQRTERQRSDRAPGDGDMTTVLHPPQLGPAQNPHPPPAPNAAGPSRVVIGAAVVSLVASLGAVTVAGISWATAHSGSAPGDDVDSGICARRGSSCGRANEGVPAVEHISEPDG